MFRGIILSIITIVLLTMPARAIETLPPELAAAVPEPLAEAAERGELLEGGGSWLLDRAEETAKAAVRGGTRNALLLVLTAVLCGAAGTLGLGEPAERYIPWCGVLAATALSAGDLRSLIGLGSATVEELGTLSALLLPALAAAMAAGGLVSSAGVWQVTTLLVCDALSAAVSTLLLPLTGCYIAAAAAGALLKESRLDAAAEGLRKLTTWALCAVTGLFTAYLSLTGVLTGSADRTAVKAAKAAVSGAIPVVGGVLSEAAEGVLAAAGTARGLIGTLGVLAILALCLTPVLRLGTQYLLYKAAAFAASLVGPESLSDYLDRLGDAFALVLAMTAACAAVLLAAMLTAVGLAV